MSDINNNDIEESLFKISKEIIIPKYQNLKEEDVKFKNNTDIVTSVDIAVEEKLNKILSTLLPDSLFIGEELYSKKPSILNFYNYNKFCWTVDPIDGTKNFTKGNDKFAIMIALSFKDVILQSWIYKPLTEDFFYSKKDEGSYFNQKRINNVIKVNIYNASGSISSRHWNFRFSKK